METKVCRFSIFIFFLTFQFNFVCLVALHQSSEANSVLTVDIHVVKQALSSLDEESKLLLGYLVTLFRMLISNSPLNMNTRSQTVMYGKEYQKKGKAQIRRRVGEGISVTDVISSFGSVLMKPAMETERTVLRLIESNAVLEYIMLNSSSLFGEGKTKSFRYIASHVLLKKSGSGGVGGQGGVFVQRRRH